MESAVEPLSSSNAWLFIGKQPYLISELESIVSVGVQIRAGNAPDCVPLKIVGLADSLVKSAKQSWTIESGNTSSMNQAHVYVPTLRGLRPHGGTDVYRARTILDYFDGLSDLADLKRNDLAAAGNRTILTGLTLYAQVLSLMTGEPLERRRKRDWEAFLGERVFGGETVEITPRTTHSRGEPCDVLYIKIGSEVERPIYHVGDGLAQVIILTFPLFAYANCELFLFIEEPETYLHPGLQRLLVEAMGDPSIRGTGDRQIFLTTHSSTVVDSLNSHDAACIMTASRELQKTEQQESFAKFKISVHSQVSRDMLTSIGVQPSSVLLSNASLWVEGIDDATYFRHMLSLYWSKNPWKGGNAPIEGLHFNFVMYGGSLIACWNWLNKDGPSPDSVSFRYCVIVDSDRPAAGEPSRKAGQREALQDKLRDRLLELPCREIENLFSPETVRSVVASLENRPEAEIFPADWSYADMQYERLGAYIEKHGTNLSRTYKSESGSILPKRIFAKQVIESVRDWNQLPPTTRKLVEQLASFILDSNGRN